MLIELAPPAGVGSRHDQLVGLLARQRGVVVAPGSRFAYNNGGYPLLAEVVRRASGQSLRAFVEARMFAPLGLSNTRTHDDPGERVPRLAARYTRRGEALRRVEGGDGVVGNAGMLTTAGALLASFCDVDRPRVGTAATRAAMQASVTLTGGEPAGYLLGLWVGTYRGRRTVAHGGSDPGISAYAVRDRPLRFGHGRRLADAPGRARPFHRRHGDRAAVRAWAGWRGCRAWTAARPPRARRSSASRR